MTYRGYISRIPTEAGGRSARDGLHGFSSPADREARISHE